MKIKLGDKYYTEELGDVELIMVFIPASSEVKQPYKAEDIIARVKREGNDGGLFLIEAYKLLPYNNEPKN